MRINAVLDRIVDKASRMERSGRGISLYEMAHLTGKILAAALIAWIAVWSGDPRMWRFYLVLISVAYFHKFLYVNRIKFRFFNIRSQSFLQDTVLFIVPMTCLMIWLLRIPMGLGLDLAGLILPLMLGFRRIGCFLGGCCFGLPSRYGVLYPGHMLENYPEDRKKNPLLIPTERVFPIQLVESLFSFALFAGLAVRLWVTRDFSGMTLLLFIWIYAAYRFVADFFRVSSMRPRYVNGKFSEAQVFSLFLMIACSALYAAIMHE